MSSHDAPGAGSHGDATHEHAFDGEPATALSPGEPQTPGWLPALGGALFVAAAVWFLAISKGEEPPTDGAASASASVAAAPAPSPAAPGAPSGRAQAQRQPTPVQPLNAPGARPAPPRKFDPADAQRVKKLLDDNHAAAQPPPSK